MSNRPDDPAPAGDHTAFCAGIRSIYQILVQAGFISADEIIWPEQQTPEQHDLLHSGPLPPEMLSLAKQLPFPSPTVHEELLRTHSERLNASMGLMITPSSGAVCYLYKDELTDSRNAFEAGLADSELLPASFKITHYGNQAGSMWLYDLATKTIAEQPYNHTPDPLRGPADQVLAVWLSNIRTLAWLPWRFETARYVDVRPAKHDYYLREGRGDSLTEEDAELAAAELNHFNARKKIYLDCGWPDDFDVRRFEAAQGEWNQEYRDICEEAEDNDLNDLVTDTVYLVDNPDLIAFVARSAGDMAV
ncbi:hypothetical protein BDZ85DRAFT_279190 [Elsinoe ampelina]|uniref:Uncharacterized protein n=1 Tax=Elsinoe ampelina TaxID=302913 RepID=A0A6A6GIE2_9PEZI|nr:hypothetical protein BDZ85DRAFT_279190 [Elsinoe ampelina]